ncbi:protein phosphatase 1 regulatory subunit 26 [Betta splendens]|uniref:Protein phosphatase 1 regulatory subunit 26 n=1 Tax=Betta splendens TaxID=158456 RepID=A0A6P7P3D3_BETSP|nr:protein phosphatase 1 regulatory subunit 26 [Betta splendens]XP_029024570.1 protein phosphatase 1 regulatory subunit 26 [Betta splendens]XP_029024571.1 protein phosphatase 1 regulatory subunit 26 [Betta splendens]XP_029024573.1 protein phosphatase 1 regulatory subunit 26 [Betta splendens]XP_029024574.1 protein phosphatase 1 regulatory subunit 26 [Betta splendens]XP_029024576.1 protein phosphatase 1 regulatory subunit 26 [Betta splendens]XP_029024577.1 protein phosphatase 1 regulatory subun
MYLMNVPPVAATQTEWRTCGPPGGYSLQCFNDSDTELSTAGTPISDKVQMIIESLRSTQSSLDMGDKIEGNMLSGQEGHPQVCRVAMGSYVGAKSKTKVSIENQQAAVSSPISHGSSDSDSDDSVDRGIEEAIREYLKEKDDHKRKAEPCSHFLQSSKIPRKSSPVPEVSNKASNKATEAFLITSSQFLKSVKVEAVAVPAGIPIKKYIKNKVSLDDNIARKMDCARSTATKSLSKEPAKSPSKSFSQLNKMKCPVSAKVEEDSNDSSSDDGIEEAIQRYQLEKRVQENRGDFNPHEFKEDSDSTSDDGIEEAIRCYQLEQLKEKTALKPFFHKQKPFSKSLVHAVGTSTENLMKRKLKKKKARTDQEIKRAPRSPVFMDKNICSAGNGLLSLKLDSFKEQSTPTPPKINTTAELMCAEAILDISKTVMPAAFHHDVGLSGCVPESFMQASPPLHCQDGESDDSSIDSEDGIEQEIRKFLEQKAQMHNQPPISAVTPERPRGNEPEKVKAKQVAAQKKRQRLSLSQRRRLKQENGGVSDVLHVDNSVKETIPRHFPRQRKDSSQVAFSQRNPTHPIVGLRKTEQSGDKSSSLDSDEDLDTAIRDLLKTKKKSKKKVKDLKRKSKKCLKEEPLVKNVLQTKKLKLDPVPKSSALKKTDKCHDDIKDKSAGMSWGNVCHSKQADENKVHGDETAMAKEGEDQETVLLHKDRPAPHTQDDSSSVDSDDSIEQEIRRFLAEKAKVSSEERSKDEDALRNGTVEVCTPLQEEGLKKENQLAEIPRESSNTPLSGKAPLMSHSQDRPLHSAQNYPDTSSAGAQSPPASIQSCSPVVLEPADGAGAARTDQRRPSPGKSDVPHATPHTERVQPVCSPNISHSRSESIKWRQSLGLPITDTKTLSRTPFHITSSKISETALANPLCQSRGVNLKSQAPASAWSSARTGRSPLPRPTETAAVNTPFRSSVLNLATARHPRTAFVQSLLPGHSSQGPAGAERASMVHIPKDKSVFVELESNRTNHVQVRSRERKEGKERADLSSEKKEVGSLRKNDKEVHLERTDEFVDEAECESGNRRNPETKQGFSTLSLSSAIDPGITFRPCIALTTAERSTMFNRSYRTQTCIKNQTVQQVKRKLQFVPVNRKGEASLFSREMHNV